MDAKQIFSFQTASCFRILNILTQESVGGGGGVMLTGTEMHTWGF